MDKTLVRVKVVSVGRENGKTGNLKDCVHDNCKSALLQTINIFIALYTNQLIMSCKHVGRENEKLEET